jgi:hypothetical protein
MTRVWSSRVVRSAQRAALRVATFCDDRDVTHIPDLAPYNYYPRAPDALAVGWLDSTEPFPTGAFPQDVLPRLKELSERPVRLMRGYHYCQFCQAVSRPPRLLRADIRLYEPPDVAHGNGEIWITGPDGVNFAAPVLIVHYIDEHGYLPPRSFIEAIRVGTPTPDLS